MADGKPALRRRPAPTRMPAAVEFCEQRTHLGFRKHHRQGHWAFGAVQAAEPGQRLSERYPIEKQQRGKRLILCCRGHVPFP